MQNDQGGGPRPQHEVQQAANQNEDRERDRPPAQKQNQNPKQDRPPGRGKDQNPKQGGRGGDQSKR